MERKIEVLMAMMNVPGEESLPLVIKQLINENNPCVAINQCTKIHPDLQFESTDLKVISMAEKGLSKSRNKALKHMRHDIGLFADDDISFTKDFQKFISLAFKEFPTADMITFQTLNEHGEARKPYPENSFWHNKKSIMKVSSVEIAFRRSSLLKSEINFDERFGLGAQFETGEENIFLADALDRGLKIRYVPRAIASHPDGSSGHGLKNNSALIKAKGAMIQRIFGRYAPMVGLAFTMKKLGQSGLSAAKFTRSLKEGMQEFKRLDREK